MRGPVSPDDTTDFTGHEYGPFGELIRATGPMAKLNPFTYQTEFYDWETDKYYWKNRYFDPSPGRWLSRDPAGEDEGGPNLYGFVGNDPIDFWDYLGWEWKVFRTGSPRAVSSCDCGDTVRQLAAKIHLEPV
jgi:RHS repeat-associated protein